MGNNCVSFARLPRRLCFVVTSFAAWRARGFVKALRPTADAKTGRLRTRLCETSSSEASSGHFYRASPRKTHPAPSEINSSPLPPPSYSLARMRNYKSLFAIITIIRPELFRSLRLAAPDAPASYFCQSSELAAQPLLSLSLSLSLFSSLLFSSLPFPRVRVLAQTRQGNCRAGGKREA